MTAASPSPEGGPERGPSPGEPAERPRETPLGVVGVGLALLLLLGLFVGQLSRPVADADGRAALAEAFVLPATDADWPADFRPGEALRLPDGRLVVRLRGVAGEDPALPEPGTAAEDAAPAEGEAGEAPQASDAPAPSGGGMGRMGPAWGAIEELDGARPARGAVLVRYPVKAAEEALRRQFSDLQFRDLMFLGGEGGAVPLATGREPWGAYEARWAHLRHFEKRGETPTFHDSLRVNLSVGRRAWVLYLEWPERVRGGLDEARPLLDVLRPRPQDG